MVLLFVSWKIPYITRETGYWFERRALIRNESSIQRNWDRTFGLRSDFDRARASCQEDLLVAHVVSVAQSMKFGGGALSAEDGLAGPTGNRLLRDLNRFAADEPLEAGSINDVLLPFLSENEAGIGEVANAVLAYPESEAAVARICPGNLPHYPYVYLDRVLISKAYLAMGAGRFDDAERWIDAAWRLNSHYAPLASQYVQRFYLANQYREMKALRRLPSLSPVWVPRLHNLDPRRDLIAATATYYYDYAISKPTTAMDLSTRAVLTENVRILSTASPCKLNRRFVSSLLKPTPRWNYQLGMIDIWVDYEGLFLTAARNRYAAEATRILFEAKTPSTAAHHPESHDSRSISSAVCPGENWQIEPTDGNGGVTARFSAELPFSGRCSAPIPTLFTWNPGVPGHAGKLTESCQGSPLKAACQP